MWDSNSPLQLLNTMPKKLSKENLEKLQLVIEADKYKNSLINGFDLCGMYAPFCRDCKKTSIYPCAIAYINMMKAGGADIEIDAKPVVSDVQSANAGELEAVQPEPLREVPVVSEGPALEAVHPAEERIEEIAVAEEVRVEEVKPEVPAEHVKKKIRIAFARRKI